MSRSQRFAENSLALAKRERVSVYERLAGLVRADPLVAARTRSYPLVHADCRSIFACSCSLQPDHYTSQMTSWVENLSNFLGWKPFNHLWTFFELLRSIFFHFFIRWSTNFGSVQNCFDSSPRLFCASVRLTCRNLRIRVSNSVQQQMTWTMVSRKRQLDVEV